MLSLKYWSWLWRQASKFALIIFASLCFDIQLTTFSSIIQKQKPLLIVAEDVESDALATLILNKLRAGIKVRVYCFSYLGLICFPMWFSSICLDVSIFLYNGYCFLQVCAIKATGFGENRKSNMQDLAVLTGGTVSFFFMLGFLVHNCVLLSWPYPSYFSKTITDYVYFVY